MSDFLVSRYPRMVHDYWMRRVKEVMEARRKRLDSIKSRKSAEKYVMEALEKVQASFAPLPKKTPLNPRVTGTLERPGFHVEKVVFESRPGFFVTGCLHMPEVKKKQKLPCVMGLCGHSLSGKAEPNYQFFCQGLALRGFMVFMIDPIYQGERNQFYPEKAEDKPQLCHGHNLMGNQMILTDDFFGTWRVWDAIRGLDYLLSRPEADHSRVGVTGNSGGGTLTTFLSALDPRLTMAAPSCYICSYYANIENELPSDAEQSPPRILLSGLDQADMLICRAPRPTLILGQKDDFFDPRRTRQSAEDLRLIYKFLGAPSDADVFIGPRGHGYYVENRQAMYKWFMRHAGVKGSPEEKGVTEIKEKDLQVLKTGDTAELKSRLVIDFTAEKAAALAKKRGKPSAEETARRALKVLKMPKISGAPHFIPLGGESGGAEFAVETEPGIHALVSFHGEGLARMSPPAGKITLFAGDSSSCADVRDIPGIKALGSKGSVLAAVDPRGIGRSRAGTCHSKEFFEPYGADYLYASTADQFGENYLGQRVFDVMRTMDFLYANGAPEIELAGRGMGSVIMAFAALLHKRKPAPKVRLINYLPSYRLLAETPVYKWPLSAMPRGILKYFDLPDVYRALGKRLTLEAPFDAMMRVSR
jgi:cephalosporin-C deacetylase-like acetyl esterase